MTSWHDDLVPDMHALILSFMDWRTGHLFARTDKANAALFAALKDRVFGPSPAVLSVPRGPLHPLNLLARGYGVEDKDVAKHVWQWTDIGDLAQFRETAIFIALLLHRPPENATPIRAYRTTLANMTMFRFDEHWRAGFHGSQNFRKVAEAENVELLCYVFGGSRALCHLLSWPDTDQRFFEDVLLSGSIRMFDLFCARRPLPPGFWHARLLLTIELGGNYALFKNVRDRGVPLVARLPPAVRSGEVAYLREALAVRLSDAEDLPAMSIAAALGRVGMIRILVEEGGCKWPTVRIMSQHRGMLLCCINAGFDPFGDRDDRASLEDEVRNLLRVGTLDSFVAQIEGTVMRLRIKHLSRH